MELAGTGDDAQTKDVVMRVSTSELSQEYRGGIPHGTRLNFTFPDDLIHLFSKETEENLL
jgi:multiple sugar transport system ATP-binding protein